MVEEIRALKELLDMGAITQDDFDRKKKEMLDGLRPGNVAPVGHDATHHSGAVATQMTQDTLVPDAPHQCPEPQTARPVRQKSKMVAGLLAIFLGGLGVHKFYLNYSKQGGIMLAVWLCSWLGMLLAFFMGSVTLLTLGMQCLLALGVISLVEGIMYLTKSDDEFESRYVLNSRRWF